MKKGSGRRVNGFDAAAIIEIQGVWNELEDGVLNSVDGSEEEELQLVMETAGVSYG